MIPLFSPLKIISKKDNKAVFEIEALYPGYGVTVGNCLRRVLLSSLEGAAVTKVKIKGVNHEFSTIPGVLEDVLQIMLNLKKLRFKMFVEEPQIAILKIKGEKEVKASDFKTPSQVELVNQGLHIATMTDKKADLEIEIQIEKGIGYLPRERKKHEKLAIGEILIDAIFTPMVKVGYQVENMRVGERTDFDKLVMDIETDGTISPEEALKNATEILLSHFSLIKDNLKEQEAEIKPEKKAKPKKAVLNAPKRRKKSS